MKAILQLAGFRSDGVSSDFISKIGNMVEVDIVTTSQIIEKANEMLLDARERGVWRPVILLALEGRRWAPDSRPGWWMGGRWLFCFDPEEDVEQLRMAISEKAIIETARFAMSPEGRKKGSGAMRELGAAVDAYNSKL